MSINVPLKAAHSQVEAMVMMKGGLLAIPLLWPMLGSFSPVLVPIVHCTGLSFMMGEG
jgi:hypothetical protein